MKWGSVGKGEWKEIDLNVPYCRAFDQRINDGNLRVIVGKEPIGWHMSISHAWSLASTQNRRIAGRIPTWEEIRDARYRFVPDDVYMAIILPPKREYVNVFDTCMHLHEIPKDQK